MNESRTTAFSGRRNKLGKVNKFFSKFFPKVKHPIPLIPPPNPEPELFFTPKSSSISSPPSELGQSSNPDEFDLKNPTFICEICTDQLGLENSFNVKGCSHFYCTQCINGYISAKLEENILIIRCPEGNCKGVLEPEYCRPILSYQVFNQWGKALCESAVNGSEKFYCPYSDCSALLINDHTAGGGERIRNSTCPFCKRNFCVECKVAWHSDLDCEKFQKLKKKGEESLLKDLASRKKWRQCPNCKSFVEKIDGCYYIRCRCKYAFCYNCGGKSSSITHQCPNCKH